MKILSLLIINLVWISCLIFQSVHGEIFIGPQLQLCIVYYDDTQAIVKFPNEYEDSIDPSEQDNKCSSSNAINAINIFVRNGYTMTEESQNKIINPDKPFGYEEITLVKP